MGHFYSKKEQGFFHTDIHGDAIPEDAVPVTDAKYRALFEAQSKGKQIIAGDDGAPVAVLVEESIDDAAERVRAQRDALLSASDVLALRAYEQGVPVPDDVQEYRQALRDVTKQDLFPKKVTWPKAPKG